VTPTLRFKIVVKNSTPGLGTQIAGITLRIVGDGYAKERQSKFKPGVVSLERFSKTIQKCIKGMNGILGQQIARELVEA
ncbi:19008_t:CDS:2, partial [Dentiscutata erythropus]